MEEGAERRGPAVITGLLLGVVLTLGAVGLCGGGIWLMSAELRAWRQATTAWIDPPTTITPSATVLVRELRTLARLETASLVLEQQVVGQRGTDGTWGWVGERLSFTARGEAVAGVDLAALGEGDLTVEEGGVVVVRLPPATLFHVRLDEEGSRVASRERGWFGWNDAQLETEVRREAVRALRAEALSRGIEELAADQAERVVEELLRAAGAADVRFRPAEQAPSPPPRPRPEPLAGDLGP